MKLKEILLDPTFLALIGSLVGTVLVASYFGISIQVLKAITSDDYVSAIHLGGPTTSLDIGAVSITGSKGPHADTELQPTGRQQLIKKLKT